MASALLEGLKPVATDLKIRQIEDSMGRSWKALAMEEDHQGRGIGTLLNKAEARKWMGRGGQEREEGRGVEQREQWEDPLTTQPNRESEPGETNRYVRGVCVGVVPYVLSKLSCALHAHRGKTLLQDLQNLENTAMKNYGKVKGSTGEKDALKVVEYLRVSHEDAMEGPL